MKKTIQRFFLSLFYVPVFLSSEHSLECSINDFAAHLYQETLSNSSKNELFSPYGLFNCLSMVYAGADLQTADEMAQALHLQIAQEELPFYLSKLSNSLYANSQNNGFTLTIANSLWIDSQFSILPAYQKMIEEGFLGKMASLDFTQKEQTALTINQWISTKTNEQITNLLSPLDISKESKLILVNTLYFKGSWARAFEVKNTQRALFYKNEQEQKLVNMMKQTHFFPYYETEEFQFLLLPFSSKHRTDREMAAFFLLPKTALSDIEQALSASFFKKWVVSTQITHVQVQIPRFEQKIQYDLTKILPHLGMISAFSDRANFSKINDHENLFINKAIHETFFSLDEKGVTAAAATAIGIGTTSIRILPPPIPFTANQPFLFGIVDLKSNVMLFLGKMIDPQ